MNILYLHGLESKLSLPKKEILEKYGTVAAPDMDYFANPKMIEWLINEYKNKEIVTASYPLINLKNIT